MSARLTRRSFLGSIPALAGAGAFILPARGVAAGEGADARCPDGVPRLDLAVVETFVTLSHRDPVEVGRMLDRQPSLARAAWDWGFGDWETGLGAASHTGGREIAERNLASGAHPTIFSAAMLGQLDVVKAMVSARPGVQRTAGPHGLTLLHHARVGGAEAAPVLAFLESVGGADEKPAASPLENADRDGLVGRYVFGPGERDVFEVDVKKDLLGIQRPGTTRRILTHTGGLVFFPSGVPSVRIAFARNGAKAERLTIADPEIYLTAKRTG